jgi:multidrug resistance efflux pump
MSDHSIQQKETPHGDHGGIGENPLISRIRKHPLITEFALLVIFAAVIGGYLYIQDMEGKIYVEKAEISAPVISLSSPVSGPIEKIYVDEGDSVSQGQRVALVGNRSVNAETQGMVIWIKNAPGQMTGPGDPIVKMVEPSKFRVVGRVQEDKGLEDIRPGQRVIFTVDAFPSRQYEGSVESVSMTSRQSDIVFSISDKREPREFEVRVLYDSRMYAELKNGMSAKMWIVK